MLWWEVYTKIFSKNFKSPFKTIKRPFIEKILIKKVLQYNFKIIRISNKNNFWRNELRASKKLQQKWPPQDNTHVPTMTPILESELGGLYRIMVTLNNNSQKFEFLRVVAVRLYSFKIHLFLMFFPYMIHIRWKLVQLVTMGCL